MDFIFFLVERLSLGAMLIFGVSTPCPATVLLKSHLMLFVLSALGVLLMKLRAEFETQGARPGERARQTQKLSHALTAAAANVELRSSPKLVVDHNNAVTVSAVGVFNKHIRIHPSIAETLSDAELSAVLTHELAHFKNNDNLKLLITPVLIGAPALFLMHAFSVAFVVKDLSTYFLWPHSLLVLAGSIAAHIILTNLAAGLALASREKRADAYVTKFFPHCTLMNAKLKMRQM